MRCHTLLNGGVLLCQGRCPCFDVEVSDGYSLVDAEGISVASELDSVKVYVIIFGAAVFVQ